MKSRPSRESENNREVSHGEEICLMGFYQMGICHIRLFCENGKFLY